MAKEKKEFSQLTAAEARAFLDDKGTRRVRVHSMTRRVLHWPYCAYCGLVALKNNTTRRALGKKCVTYE